MVSISFLRQQEKTLNKLMAKISLLSISKDIGSGTYIYVKWFHLFPKIKIL